MTGIEKQTGISDAECEHRKGDSHNIINIRPKSWV